MTPTRRLKMMARWPPSTLKMLCDRPYRPTPPRPATLMACASCCALRAVACCMVRLRCCAGSLWCHFFRLALLTQAGSESRESAQQCPSPSCGKRGPEAETGWAEVGGDRDVTCTRDDCARRHALMLLYVGWD